MTQEVLPGAPTPRRAVSASTLVSEVSHSTDNDFDQLIHFQRYSARRTVLKLPHVMVRTALASAYLKRCSVSPQEKLDERIDSVNVPISP